MRGLLNKMKEFDCWEKLYGEYGVTWKDIPAYGAGLRSRFVRIEFIKNDRQ